FEFQLQQARPVGGRAGRSCPDPGPIAQFRMPAFEITASERRLSLAAAICCTAVAGIAMGLTWPLLALILRQQGMSNSLIGLSSTTQSLAVFLVAPVAPRLVVRFGLVPTILACVAATLAALLLLPLFLD